MTETLKDEQSQSFEGSIEPRTFAHGPDRLEVKQLSALLSRGQRILIPGDQPPNPHLLTINGQSLLATIGTRGRGLQPGERVAVTPRNRATILLSRVNELNKDISYKFPSAREGSYLLHMMVEEPHPTGTHIVASSLIGEHTQSGIVSPDTNLEWGTYGVEGEKEEHADLSNFDFIVSNFGQSVAILNQSDIPIGVETRAFPEHQKVLA